MEQTEGGVSGGVSRHVKMGLGDLPVGGGGVCRSNEHKKIYTTVATCGVSGEVSRQAKVGLGDLPVGWRGLRMSRRFMNHVSNNCTYHIHVSGTVRTYSWHFA